MCDFIYIVYLIRIASLIKYSSVLLLLKRCIVLTKRREASRRILDCFWPNEPVRKSILVSVVHARVYSTFAESDLLFVVFILSEPIIILCYYMILTRRSMPATRLKSEMLILLMLITARASSRWERLFSSLVSLRKACEKDYK